MGNYITQTEAEARLSATVLAAILDDDNDGSADADPLARLIEDAESYVDENFEAIYPGQLPFDPVPRVIKRLALDALDYFAARRHPEIVRKDWVRLKEVLDEDLEKQRVQHRTLAERPPDPAANQGGSLVPAIGSGFKVPVFNGHCKWGIF